MRVSHKENGYETYTWHEDGVFYGSTYYLGKWVYTTGGHNTPAGVIGEANKEISKPCMKLINQV